MRLLYTLLGMFSMFLACIMANLGWNYLGDDVYAMMLHPAIGFGGSVAVLMIVAWIAERNDDIDDYDDTADTIY